MRLERYFAKYKTPLAVFARQIGLSSTTIRNICEGREDFRLTVAAKIELATEGWVTAVELLPPKFFLQLGYEIILDKEGRLKRIQKIE